VPGLPRFWFTRASPNFSKFQSIACSNAAAQNP